MWYGIDYMFNCVLFFSHLLLVTGKIYHRLIKRLQEKSIKGSSNTHLRYNVQVTRRDALKERFDLCMLWFILHFSVILLEHFTSRPFLFLGHLVCGDTPVAGDTPTKCTCALRATQFCWLIFPCDLDVRTQLPRWRTGTTYLALCLFSLRLF